jgi:tetratricopeptide (TPR) repeat protein
VFGVSTDVLFGTFGTSDDEAVDKIMEDAFALKNDFVTAETLKRVYDALQDGLRSYPNNIVLLMANLEYGISLAYPENDTCDAANSKEIYQECIRIANLIISYGKNTTDILRANMVMVLLHSSHGNMEKAWGHANKFPWRSDMTAHVMSAYIAHAEKNYPKEALHCQRDIMYHFEAMLCSIAQLGDCYRVMQQYGDAIQMYESIFALIDVIFANEPFKPPIHRRERGDVYALMARTYLAMGNKDKALDYLEKMMDYDISVLDKNKDDLYVKSPSLRDVEYDFWYTWDCWENCKKRLLKKLNNTDFDSLKSDERFSALLYRANAITK